MIDSERGEALWDLVGLPECLKDYWIDGWLKRVPPDGVVVPRRSNSGFILCFRWPKVTGGCITGFALLRDVCYYQIKKLKGVWCLVRERSNCGFILCVFAGQK